MSEIRLCRINEATRIIELCFYGDERQVSATVLVAPKAWAVEGANYDQARAAHEAKVTQDAQAALRAGFTDAVQRHLDARAKAKGYDNIFTAATYADEPAVAQFQTEGRAFRQWRSNVWAKCYQIMADVQAGLRPQPSVEQLIAELPAAPL